MKHPPFETLIEKAGRQFSLSAAEREKMRFVLREYAAFKPRRAGESAPLPTYQIVVTALWASVRRPVPSLAAIVLVIATASGSIAVAAEGTFPGDALYPIKVAVLEPIRTSFAFSAATKAARQRELAERRLTEAATLAQRGALGTTTEFALRARFEQNANAAFNNKYTGETADISAESFAARLSAYESILTQIDDANGRDTTGAFRSAIRAQIGKAASTTSAAEDRPDVARLKTAANSALRASADLLGSVSDTLGTPASTHAQRELEDAETLTNQGNELLQEHDTEGASKAFRGSLNATARLDVLTRAAATLNVDAFATKKRNSKSGD